MGFAALKLSDSGVGILAVVGEMRDGGVVRQWVVGAPGLLSRRGGGEV